MNGLLAGVDKNHVYYKISIDGSSHMLAMSLEIKGWVVILSQQWFLESENVEGPK